MSSFVDRVFSIWEDLEVSYDKLSRGESKKDFILKLIGYDASSETTKLDTLKANILNHYEGNEEKCDLLTKIFDTVADNTKAFVEVEEIEDLNDFVGRMIQDVDKSSKEVSFSLPDDFFKNLNPFLFSDRALKLPLENYVNATGFITDVITLDEQGPISYLADYDSSGVVIFKGGMSVREFVSRLNKNDKFFITTHKIVQKLLASKEMPEYVIFVSSSNFSFRAGKVKLWNKGAKIDVELIKKDNVGEEEYLVCRHKNEYLETPVYCIL